MAVEKQGNELIFTGIAYYAQVHRPSQYGAWKIDLVVDDDTATELRKLGLKQASSIAGQDEFGNNIFKPKVYENHPGKCFSFKRKTHNRTGAEMTPPTVVNAALEPTTEMIGNGSKVRVKIGLYPTKDSKGNEMQGAGLNAIQILDLVPFESNSSGGSNLSGFTAVKGAKTTTSNTVDF